MRQEFYKCPGFVIPSGVSLCYGASDMTKNSIRTGKFSEVFTLCVYTDPVQSRKIGCNPWGWGLEPRTNWLKANCSTN